jgi:hypothetical protein
VVVTQFEIVDFIVEVKIFGPEVEPEINDDDVVDLDDSEFMEEVEDDFVDVAADVDDLNTVDNVDRVVDDLEDVEVDCDVAEVAEVEEADEVADDLLVEVLLDVLEVAVPDDVDLVDEKLLLDEVVIEEELVVDEVELELEELLVPPPDKTAHVLPKPTVLLNESEMLLAELPLVTSNLVVDTCPEARM